MASASSLGQRRLVDAVNVGFAVTHLEEMNRLVQLLRVGGRLTVPICNAAPPQAAGPSCDAQFQVYERAPSGALERVAGDTGVPVKFVRAVSLPAMDGKAL